MAGRSEKMIRKAVIQGNYRYSLYREWDAEKLCVLWIMLNPSIADRKQDDPTIKKIIRISDKLGFGSLYVGNLYAYICTDSKQLLKNSNINYVGMKNYFYTASMINICNTIILGCGRLKNNKALIKMFNFIKPLPVYCLKINKDGTPAHPLYLPERNIKLLRYEI